MDLRNSTLPSTPVKVEQLSMLKKHEVFERSDLKIQIDFFKVYCLTCQVENQTPSLINNIFCNNFSDLEYLLNFSQHFCQFVSVKREKI